MTTLVKPKPDLLPVTYIEAKASLAKCQRVDECKRWADRALALKSYGKQAKDTALANMAQRIRDRAVRRGGDLLKLIKAKRGANQNIRVGAHPNVLTRKEAAKAAGLSPQEAKQMVRVANVAAEEFEQRVERAKAATVEELAALGTKKKTIERPPFCDEWWGWKIHVKYVATIPECGLEVLAARLPEEVDELHAECARAMTNLQLWQQILEAQNVDAKETTDDDREAARAD